MCRSGSVLPIERQKRELNHAGNLLCDSLNGRRIDSSVGERAIAAFRVTSRDDRRGMSATCAPGAIEAVIIAVKPATDI